MAMKIRDYCLFLLGRRDYAEVEVLRKLEQKYLDMSLEEISKEIDWLKEHGLIDDQRFCQAKVRSLINKGKAPAFIKQTMRQFNLNPEFVEQTIESQQIDWFDKAYEVCFKKFKTHEDRLDAKDYGKRVRFLLSRGFSYEQAKNAIDLCQNQPNDGELTQ